MKLATYHGFSPILLQVARKYGAGILIESNYGLELWFGEGLSFPVSPDDVTVLPFEAADIPIQHTVLAREYEEPLTLPPTNFWEWTLGKSFEEMLAECEGAGFERWQAIAMEWWRRRQQDFMDKHSGEFPDLISLSQFWSEAQRIGKDWADRVE